MPCPPLPPALISWSTPRPLAASSVRAGLATAALRVGQAVALRLSPTNAIHYVQQPAEPGGSVAYGGMASLSVPAAGTYRVAIGNRAWIDVLQKAMPVESSAHRHGPACSGIGKMVDFPLAAGPAVLQFSGSGQAELEVLILPVTP